MAIQVTQVLAATNADVLAGTQLDQTPEPGMYSIWAASTVNDSTITVSLGGVTLINAQPLNLRVNGVPSLLDDPPLIIGAPAGTRPVINIIEVTAMSAYIIIIFTPAGQ